MSSASAPDSPNGSSASWQPSQSGDVAELSWSRHGAIMPRAIRALRIPPSLLRQQAERLVRQGTATRG